ncbi:MAG: tRNA pseudouridine(54/55) synthase Pus10 [Candidatus Micrarchaeota archaeon]
MVYTELRDKILEHTKGKICDDCLGRQFAQAFEERPLSKLGAAVRKAKKDADIAKLLGKEIKTADGKECPVCLGLFAKTDEFIEKLEKEAKLVDFSSFQVGCRLPDKAIETEDGLWEKAGAESAITIKQHINSLYNHLLSKKTGKEVKRDNSDVVFLINFTSGIIEAKINSLFIYGKYLKLKRGMPQTKWPCTHCKGSGCEKCGQTGRQFPETVEELIAETFLKETKAIGTKFHGCISNGSSVAISNGYSLPITDFRKPHSLISKGSGLIETDSTDYLEFNPKKAGLETYEIVTSDTGRSLTASSCHPIFTAEGKKQVSELRLGDRVTILPTKEYFFEKTGSDLLVDEELIKKTAQKYFEKPMINYHVKELVSRGLLPLRVDNPKMMILARLFGFISGDGTMHYTRGRDVAISFYGKPVDLEEVKRDIEILGFEAAFQRTRSSFSIVKDYDGNEKTIKGTNGTERICNSKALWLLFASLGLTVGNKTRSGIKVPLWIMKAPRHIKREFLASLFGAEMSKPRLDNRKYNKKSFNTPIFSVNVIEDLKKMGLKFAGDLAKLCKDFNVVCLPPRIIPYTTCKDGSKTVKIRLDFSNKYENLINLYGKIGFRYCRDREIESYYACQYLKTKKRLVEGKKLVIRKALQLKKETNLTPSGISKKVGRDIMPYKELWQYLSGNRKAEKVKVSNSFLDYPKWKAEHTKGLEEPLVWETIESMEKKPCNCLVDITVDSPTHAFFANGFMVSNSGREDRDALMLGEGRPFVLELKEPSKRSIDLKKMEKAVNKSCKGKVEVRELRFSDKEEVRYLKSIAYDKTYSCLVKCESVTKEDLKKINEKFADMMLSQRTPTRVAHRRADKVRKRLVYFVKCEPAGKDKFKVVIKSQAGTYIKELISGDSGRTKPSFSEEIGRSCEVEELDVVEIHKTAEEIDEENEEND